MPYMVNGIGTTILPGRGYIRWGQAYACDAVQWFVIFLIPVIPYKTVHAFNWVGTQYLAVPIRWSLGLVVRSAVRSWLEVFGLAAVLFAILAGIFWFKDGLTIPSVIFTVLTVVLGLTSWLGFKIWNWTDRRQQNLRYVLGPHQAGSSDPAGWTEPMLAGIRDPRDLYATPTFAEAVGTMLAQGNYCQAMWAARLTTVLEYPEEGERLTDDILRHPGVEEGLREMLAGRRQWEEVMLPPKRAGEAIPEVQPVTRGPQDVGIQEGPR
jgi:hypothetical protein